MRARTTPQAVEREGIGHGTARLAMAARARGRRARLVASPQQTTPGGVSTSVRLVELDESDLLAGLRGVANALILQTDVLGEIAICQLSGGLEQTAYALLSDLVTIASAVQRTRARHDAARHDASTRRHRLVLDFTRVLSGPYCTMQLADLGARVIKIEQPGRGDDTRAWGPPFVNGESAYFLSINRNKESLTLDLKQPAARGDPRRAAARADVLVENFRPGTMGRLGLGYELVAARHPRLVYCSISGFGQTGPRAQEPGYDAVMQAEGGLMSVTGAADGPPYRLGVAIADLATGLFAAQGLLAALIARGTTGRGQRVDIAHAR